MVEESSKIKGKQVNYSTNSAENFGCFEKTIPLLQNIINFIACGLKRQM